MASYVLIGLGVFVAAEVLWTAAVCFAARSPENCRPNRRAMRRTVHLLARNGGLR